MSSNQSEEKVVVTPDENPKKRQRTESSSSDDEIGNRAVLPVAVFDESFTENSIPSTGEEYLALVRIERKRLHGTIIAEEIKEQPLDIKDLLSLDDISPLTVKKTRVDVIIESFETDRSDVKIGEGKDTDAPSDADRHAWLKYFYGIDHSKPEKPEKEPDVEKILSDISREMAMQLLSFHNAWLAEMDPKLISFELIYRLLVITDDRLTPSQADKLRSLARHCMRLLESETVTKVCERLEEIVVIVTIWFGQKDLVHVVAK